MSSRVTRIVLILIGVAAIVTGGVWVGQGLNLIPGSFMTGDRTWLFIGVVVVVAGVVLIRFGVRRRPAPSESGSDSRDV